MKHRQAPRSGSADNSRNASPAAPATAESGPGAEASAGFFTAGFKPPWWLVALLVAVTLLAYLPAIRGDFLWDDDSWTTNLSGLFRDFSGLWVIWSKPTALQQYYPVTGTSFWIDYHLWGFRPLPYHIENVLLHALAAILFGRLLWRLQVPAAWLAAALFALHPLMVESVGWITERKNLLSLVLYLAALLAYGRFTRFWTDDGEIPPLPTGAEPRAKPWGEYTLSFGLFLGALLAKATAFSWPAVILLLAWWKRGRLRWRADVLPTLPFFGLTVGLGLQTLWLEKNHVGAQGPDWALSFAERCLIAGRAVWFYVGKLIWPLNLSFVYPRWQLETSSWAQWLFPIAALVVLLALWFARGRIGRGPLVAGLFFVGTLFPVLGFMNAFFMRYSFVCDHWVYLSSLGLIALGAALIARLAGPLRAPAGLRLFAAVTLPLLALLTWRQSRMYADADALWRTTLRRNPNAFLAHNNLGLSLYRRGRLAEAIAHLQKAVAIHPGGAESQNNLGQALLQSGRADEAIPHFQQALTLQPGNNVARANLGVARGRQGRLDEAIAEFDRVLRSEPDNLVANAELGLVLMQKGQPDQAIIHLEKARHLNPRNPQIEESLGLALLQNGQTAAADEHFGEAVRLDPRLAAVHARLGRICLQQRQPREAIAHFQAALAGRPADPSVCNDLAWVLATCPEPALRNGTRALELAHQANQLSGGNNPAILATLAAAYAEAGQFPEAVTTARRALGLAIARTNSVAAAQLEARIELYRSGSPFRDPALAPAKGASGYFTR